MRESKGFIDPLSPGGNVPARSGNRCQKGDDGVSRSFYEGDDGVSRSFYARRFGGRFCRNPRNAIAYETANAGEAMPFGVPRPLGRPVFSTGLIFVVAGGRGTGYGRH